MKKCTKCNILKSLTEYYKHNTSKDGLQPYCKQCVILRANEFSKENYKKSTLPYTVLYYIPAHNYIGITNCPHKRMYQHKRHNKFNTDNWIEIARYTNRIDAIIMEAKLHRMGYSGYL